VLPAESFLVIQVEDYIVHTISALTSLVGDANEIGASRLAPDYPYWLDEMPLLARG
jgi:hypothetical protein